MIVIGLDHNVLLNLSPKVSPKSCTVTYLEIASLLKK